MGGRDDGISGGIGSGAYSYNSADSWAAPAPSPAPGAVGMRSQYASHHLPELQHVLRRAQHTATLRRNRHRSIGRIMGASACSDESRINVLRPPQKPSFSRLICTSASELQSIARHGTPFEGKAAGADRPGISPPSRNEIKSPPPVLRAGTLLLSAADTTCALLCGAGAL
jgi:hypothetical protein